MLHVAAVSSLSSWLALNAPSSLEPLYSTAGLALLDIERPTTLSLLVPALLEDAAKHLEDPLFMVHTAISFLLATSDGFFLRTWQAVLNNMVVALALGTPRLGRLCLLFSHVTRGSPSAHLSPPARGRRVSRPPIAARLCGSSCR